MVGRHGHSARGKQVAALLLSSPDAAAAIAKECHDLTVLSHRSVADLLATVRQHDVAIVVMDLVDAHERPMTSAAEAVRALQRDLPIVAYCKLTPTSSLAIPDFVRCPGTSLIFRGIHDAGVWLRSALRSARRAVVEGRVYDEISVVLPDTVRLLLRYALSVSSEAFSVEDAALSLGVDRKTLLNRLRRTGDITPREFINWIRIAVAIGLLEQGGRSAEQVALEVGFTSGTAFRNMVQRYVGMRPAELRDAGGLAALLVRFRAVLTPAAAPSADAADEATKILPFRRGA